MPRTCMLHDMPHWCITLSQVSSSKVALDSRARTRFQASYIDRIQDNTLLANVKGTAVWRKDPGRQTEGYYVFSPKLNKYQAIHYIKED